MNPPMHRYLLLIAMGASAASAFGKDAGVTNVYVAPEGTKVLIEVDLSQPTKPNISMETNPRRLVLEFPNTQYALGSEYLTVNRNGVNDVQAGPDPANRGNTRVIVQIDAAHPYTVTSVGNKFLLSILPNTVNPGAVNPDVAHAGTASPSSAKPSSAHSISSVPSSPRPSPVHTASVSPVSFTSATWTPQADSSAPAPAVNDPAQAPTIARLVSVASSKPEVTHLPLNVLIEQPESVTISSVAVRHNFKVKYISGNTVYIDGGTNSGLRPGMDLEIRSSESATSGVGAARPRDAFVATVRVVGVAAASAITEVSESDRAVQVGDAAELLSQDAASAGKNVQTAARSSVPLLRVPAKDAYESSSLSGGVHSNSLLASQRQPAPVSDGTRMAGRIGFDYSSITSTGSTPGTSTARGISFQSDMTHILGTHWNLQGYWRGRVTDHAQFKEPTIEESLNKTYTMQLYYENPNSRWVAGVGRLYLPWAVSLDTIDGGYLGRKWPLGMTTGVFAGSTPDLNSWHYRPNQRIAGSFVNFEGGDYERVHYTSTAGVGINTIGWRTDRPFAFLENELSYKNKVTVYHSLIADTLHGLSTNGMRLPAGVSHSYFTAHYMPNRVLSFDVYHNYFRDVPTATTTIVGTGLVDRLLFQGLSGGVHVKPIRNLSLYTTLGASEKTGDSHRSLNQMYGASWSEIARSGIRADFHYSKFDSNFGTGNYKVLSLSRQVTNHAFWNVQAGKQDLLSYYTTNHNTLYISDSLDINVGRRSYFQSGYTWVNGATMNYRQLYFSWGYRFDRGRSSPEYVQTQGPVH